MNNTVVKVVLPLFGLGVAVVLAAVAYFFISAWWSQPPSVAGFGDGPVQPVEFPHTVHVQQAALDCQFCHRTVSTDEAASVPPVEQCLFCHAYSRIDGSVSTSSTAEKQIAVLRSYAYGPDETPDTGDEAPINWTRVHRVPDHVQFVHSPHIQRGISCSTCHGDVGSFEVVKQVENLKMRQCVDCHRNNGAPTDCTTCHY